MKYVDGAFESARSLLGKQVIVSLADDVVAEGKLLSIADSAELVLVDDEGFVHYCWPLLDINAATPENVDSPTPGGDA